MSHTPHALHRHTAASQHAPSHFSIHRSCHSSLQLYWGAIQAELCLDNCSADSLGMIRAFMFSMRSPLAECQVATSSEVMSPPADQQQLAMVRVIAVCCAYFTSLGHALQESKCTEMLHSSQQT